LYSTVVFGPEDQMSWPRRRRRHLSRTILVLVALGAPGLAGAALAPSTDCLSSRGRLQDDVQSACFAMEHAGRQRTVRIYPEPRLTVAAPLILVLHGGGGSASSMELLTRAAFNRIADREGAIVVYAEGVDRHWNDGRDLPETAARENVDDVGFILALIEEVARRQPLDRGRIYATGISNGGFMSMRLACDAAETFAAVAPVTAVLSEKLGARCAPARPVAIMIVNGTEDPLVPWAGGEVKVLGVSRGAVWSADRTFERWLELDGCSRSRRGGARTDNNPADKTVVVVHRERCRVDVEVRLYEIQGGGHTWPGGVAYASERLVGRVSQEMDASREIWTFMKWNARSNAKKEPR
jgi:polyhydroxybutyrate depolymerase